MSVDRTALGRFERRALIFSVIFAILHFDTSILRGITTFHRARAPHECYQRQTATERYLVDGLPSIFSTWQGSSNRYFGFNAASDAMDRPL